MAKKRIAINRTDLMTEIHDIILGDSNVIKYGKVLDVMEGGDV